MLVFSGDDDFKDSKAKFGKTLPTLQQHGIRVYAMLFGNIDMGTYYIFWNGLGSLGPITDNFSRDTEDLNNLAYRTGGYLSVENTRNELQQYKLNDDGIKQVSQNGWQLYGGIAETYALQVDGSEDEVSSIRIELAPDARVKVPGAVVVQSINAAACQSVPTLATANEAR
jgi:hypothetical protein